MIKLKIQLKKTLSGVDAAEFPCDTLQVDDDNVDPSSNHNAVAALALSANDRRELRKPHFTRWYQRAISRRGTSTFSRDAP